MLMDKNVANWISSAEYDLETADFMFKSGRYIYTVFMCHLALEKALKAKVAEVTGMEPPRSHDLEYLGSLGGLSPDSETEEFIAELTNLSVTTRYPIDFESTVAEFSGERSETIMEKTGVVFEWIVKSIEP